MADHLFWNQLLARRDAIAGIDPDSPRGSALIEEHLSTLVEQYAGAFDPADDFEAYVTVALCRVVAIKLAELNQALPVC